jgi:hypothetical protein
MRYFAGPSSGSGCRNVSLPNGFRSASKPERYPRMQPTSHLHQQLCQRLLPILGAVQAA